MSDSRRLRIRTRRLLGSTMVNLVLIVVCACALVPGFALLLGSFKTTGEFFSDPFALPRSFDLQNYIKSWDLSGLPTGLRNSVIVTAISVGLGTLLSLFVAYAVRGMRSRGALALKVLFVSGLAVPVQLIMLPIFVSMRVTGLLGSLFPMIIVYMVFAMPLAVLIFANFFAALPRELIEAGRLDGASETRILFSIILPIARPAMVSAIVLNGVWIWNDFFIPLLLATTESVQTAPLVLLNLNGVYSTDWGLIFATVVLSAIPVIAVYLPLNRYFISGLTAGGVKG